MAGRAPTSVTCTAPASPVPPQSSPRAFQPGTNISAPTSTACPSPDHSSERPRRWASATPALPQRLRDHLDVADPRLLERIGHRRKAAERHALVAANED